jgi:hypothetical protein
MYHPDDSCLPSLAHQSPIGVFKSLNGNYGFILTGNKRLEIVT